MSGLQIIELPAGTENSDDEKWQKLVLYYLARLKGLCDWRNSHTKTKSKINPKKCSSEELETRIIDNVRQKSSRLKNVNDINDINCYMAAGYEEGKQQAVKIITRSLKYGVMTGILLKRGNCYRIAPEYLDEPPTRRRKDCGKCCKRRRRKLSVKSVKTNVRKKNMNKKQSRGKKRKHAVDHTCVKKKKCNSTVDLNENKKGTKRSYDYSSDENPPVYKKNKRTSDTNINPQMNSGDSKSESKSITPIDERDKKRDVKAKRPRAKIQKPINYVPPLKKPRTESQSASPSHHTDEDVEKCSSQLINKFRMPRPRRYSTVMSSISSSSLSSSCACDDKRTRRK